MMSSFVSLQWKVGRLPGIFFKNVTCLHGAICFVPFFASAPVFYALNFEGPKINVLLTPPVRQMSMSDCQNGGAKKNNKCRRSVDVCFKNKTNDRCFLLKYYHVLCCFLPRVICIYQWFVFFYSRLTLETTPSQHPLFLCCSLTRLRQTPIVRPPSPCSSKERSYDLSRDVRDADENESEGTCEEDFHVTRTLCLLGIDKTQHV